jgi:hypothetical protein
MVISIGEFLYQIPVFKPFPYELLMRITKIDANLLVDIYILLHADCKNLLKTDFFYNSQKYCIY